MNYDNHETLPKVNKQGLQVFQDSGIEKMEDNFTRADTLKLLDPG